MNWVYNGIEVKSIEDNILRGHFGFTYQITHIPSGKIYIGRKNFFTQRNIKLGKKELAILREERKKKKMRGRAPSKKLVVKESDWKIYYGSNKELLRIIKIEGKENFKREIIEFAFNKKHLTYLETYYLFKYEVLFNPDKFYNDTILGKFYTRDFSNPLTLDKIRKTQ